MSDRKVSQLVGLSGSDIDPSSDMLHIVDKSVPESKHITISQLLVGMQNLPSASNSTVDPDNDKVLLYDDSTDTVSIVSVSDLVDKLRTEKLTFSSGWDPVTTSNGWTKNSNGASKTFAHGLNTTDFQITIMGASNSSGDGATVVSGTDSLLLDGVASKKRYGSLVHTIDNSGLTVQLGKDGYIINLTGGHEISTRNWSWIKIVCRK